MPLGTIDRPTAAHDAVGSETATAPAGGGAEADPSPDQPGIGRGLVADEGPLDLGGLLDGDVAVDGVWRGADGSVRFLPAGHDEGFGDGAGTGLHEPDAPTRRDGRGRATALPGHLRPLMPERRWCLGCGYEAFGPVAEQFTACPSCGAEYSAWKLTEVRRLPAGLMAAWLVMPAFAFTLWPTVARTIWPEGDAWEPGIAGHVVFAVAVVYLWAWRLMREHRVPWGAVFAVLPAAGACIPLGLVYLWGWAMSLAGPEGGLAGTVSVALPAWWVARSVMRPG